MFNNSNVKFKRAILENVVFRKRILCIVAASLVLMAILAILNRPEKEENVHAMLLQCQEERKISRQQMLKYEQILKSTCRAHYDFYNEDIPIIYVITPTYKRPVQKAELTRLSHTFMLVPKLHWIIVEDSSSKTDLVANLLEESKINFTHLFASTPPVFKLHKKDPHWTKPRGVQQRNVALEWLRFYRAEEKNKGVVYFADDDNSYSLKIFEEMRWIKKVGVWPVGLVGGLKVEKPLVNIKGQVQGFNSLWAPERPFPIDMAGFAINLNLLNKMENVKFSFDVKRGYQESHILSQLVNISDLEPLASNCTKVYVWHTRTVDPTFQAENKLAKMKKKPSDYNMEV